MIAQTPTAAQITSYVDESGRRVYVNFEAPAPRKATRPAAKVSGTAPAAQPASSTAVPIPADAPRMTVRNREDIERIVKAASERHRVDPALIRAVIQQESGWRTDAVSRKGATGLMQLMPATAAEHGVDPLDPEQNVDTGVKILRRLLEKYNGDLDRALAAYNAGEGAVKRAGGVPNYAETRNYVQSITNNYYRPGSGRAPTAFETTRRIYKIVDERGRVIYVNE